MEHNKKPLSTEPYKGVRDFYPEDMFVQNYIFNTMRSVVEYYGYEEYGASILEPTELYKAKSGEEIVTEQTYSFKDRGDRDVTLRPEMTPTVTRMVAARKRELSYPLRWYSIPNLFRYEKPQRGRLREHYQLNVDLFGDESIQAEIEILTLAYRLMKRFGAKDEWFTIKINNRMILNYLLEQVFELDEQRAYSVAKLIDRRSKISSEEFDAEIEKMLGKKSRAFLNILSARTIEEFSEKAAEETSSEVLGVRQTKEILDRLAAIGITNALFDPTLVRGFDYYTGLVFEVFDTHPENIRSIFGGGRFDDLLSVYGTDKVPAVGFGMGDVTIRDFLETHDLIPDYAPTTELMVCVVDSHLAERATEFSDELRKIGLNVAVDYSGRKIAQQIQSASKKSIPFIVCIGENEIREKAYSIKNLATGEERKCRSPKDIIDTVKQRVE